MSPLLYRYDSQFCRASSLLSSFSSLGWCRSGDRGVRTLAAKCHFFPPPSMPPFLHPTAHCNVSIDVKKGGHCRRNLRVLSTEEMAQKNDWSPPQKSHQSLKDPSSSPPPLCTPYCPLFYPALSLSHILNLSIYLYSHLFTFSFKISAYKRVYKLKIIFFLFFLYKWHLQGKGVRGTEVSHCITRAYVEAAPNTV